MHVTKDGASIPSGDILLQKLAAIAFGAGCCICLWVFGRGNQEIFALPLAFWIGVYFWPDGESLSTSNGRPAWQISTRVRSLLCVGAVASWTAAIAGMISAMGFTSASNVRGQKAIEFALLQAEAEYQKSEFAKSLALLEGLSISDNHPLHEARRSHDRGLALLRLHRNAEAFESLLTSLHLDPKNVEAACLLSEIALNQGDLQTARLYFDRAQAINASDVSVERVTRKFRKVTSDRGTVGNP